MGLAALVVAPLAGRIIITTSTRLESLFAGYQAVFVLAFLFGMPWIKVGGEPLLLFNILERRFISRTIIF